MLVNSSQSDDPFGLGAPRPFDIDRGRYSFVRSVMRLASSRVPLGRRFERYNRWIVRYTIGLSQSIRAVDVALILADHFGAGLRTLGFVAPLVGLCRSLSLLIASSVAASRNFDFLRFFGAALRGG